MSRSSKRATIALAAGLALLAALVAGPGVAAKSLSHNPRARLAAPDTLRGAASSVGQMALPFGLPASYPRSVRHSPVAHAGYETGSKSQTTVVLGSTATTPDPSCPGLPCQAVGSVTGFQVSTGQGSLPFRVTRDGRVTAWTLTLAQPTNSQRSFFNGFFGTPPEARLSILRRVPGTSTPRYSLRSQGSIHVLSPYFGQTVRFGASLEVEQGDIVALTIPTWAPAFAQDLTAKDAWRASREPGKCTNTTDVRQGQPQEQVGRRATYGCRYSTARLLYTATLVE